MNNMKYALGIRLKLIIISLDSQNIPPRLKNTFGFHFVSFVFSVYLF